MNSRRKALKSILAASSAGLLASCQKQGSSSESNTVTPNKIYEWKMVTTWPKNFPALGTGAALLAKRIEEMSGGRIKIRVYGAGELVPALGIFDAVREGSAEMGHGAAYYWKGKHEASQFFGAVPFGLNAIEMNAWIYYGGGQALWDELYAGFGLKPFIAGQTGVQMGGWFNKDINSLQDFKGLKMRMPGLGGEVLREVGATIVNLPGGEIFQALQSNTIDATEWVGPYNDLAFGFYQAAKNYYWPGWHEPTATLECFFNKAAFDSLPPDLQAIVERACQMANQDMFAEYVARNASALETLVSEHGVRVKKFPDEVLKKLGETSKEVVREVAKRDPLTQRVYDSFEAFRKKQLSYVKVTEEGYTLARALSDS